MMSRLFSTLNRSTLIFLALLLASISMSSRAQTIDTAITGVVSDSSGAVIPGATVTVTSASTGESKSAVTSRTGDFSITYLIPGTYQIAVTATGFGAYTQTGVVLQLDQMAKINVAMKVASSQQVVQVEEAPPMLQTQDPSIGTVVGNQQAENLPLNGRKFDDLAALTPGVTVTDPDNHTSGGGSGSSINSFGSNVVWSSITVDGVLMDSNRHSYFNLFPSVDAVEEFKVLTGNTEAEYGGIPGSITNLQLKSGSNQFHGDVFEFFRNPVLDARNFFRNAPLSKQVLKQNQFGGTFGGPIFKDRTFFFGSYEGLRSVEQTAGLTDVLTPAQINGDFSATTGTQLISPCTGLPYPDNQIPTGNTPANTSSTCFDGLSTVSQNIAKNYMPLPNANSEGENYSDFTEGYETVNQFIGRIDHKFNDKNQFNIHYIYALRHNPGVKADPYFKTNSSLIAQNAGLQYVHIFSPSMVNEFRAGSEIDNGKSRNDLGPNTTFTAASIGINGFVQPNGQPWPPSEEGFPGISISNVVALGDTVNDDDAGVTLQMVDNVTRTQGKNTMIIGTDIEHHQDDADTSNTPLSSISFTGTETAYNAPSGKPTTCPTSATCNYSGNAAADFMIGSPASIITPEGVPLTNAREWKDYWYFQDNWKATTNLTLNLGIRYDLYLPPRDLLNTSETLNWSVTPVALVSLPNPLWSITHKDFGPRIGFAYGLPWNSVIRGGYGITYFGGQFDNINILQLNPPDDPSFTLVNGNCGYLNCPSLNPPLATLANPVPPSLKASVANIVSLPNPDTHPDLYLQTFNLTLSKQFWSNVIDIGYVGVKGTHQDTSLLNFNTGPPQATAVLTVQQNRPYPTYGQMRIIDYHGASYYSGLQVHFQHRLSHNLEFTIAYAWSHLMDNQASDINGSRNETQIPTAKVWAKGLTDQRNILTIAFTYQLPKVTGWNPMARAIVNGWGLSSIFQFLAGNPFVVLQSADGQNNGNNFEYPDFVPGKSLNGPKTPLEWFNTAAFQEAKGHYGDIPRNPLVSPSNDPLTMGLRRLITTHEQQQLEIRIESFNTLNTPQFAAPGATQGSGSFGKITATSLDNREVQGSMKYFF